MPNESVTVRYANLHCPNGFPAVPMPLGHRGRSCGAGIPPTPRPARSGC